LRGDSGDRGNARGVDVDVFTVSEYVGRFAGVGGE
jgi:hypothetical protein